MSTAAPTALPDREDDSMSRSKATPQNDAPVAIRARGLCKSYLRQKRESGLRGVIRYLFQPEYETIPAVQDVSFEIGKGEMVAYIGPNGAGKSTTVKMLVGILVPTAGTVEVAGLVPHENRKENARRIGVVFGQRTRLWWDIPVRDSFTLIRHMYSIPEATYTKNLELFREVLDLDSFFDTPVRQLSLGQRMRAGPADIGKKLRRRWPARGQPNQPIAAVGGRPKDRILAAQQAEGAGDMAAPDRRNIRADQAGRPAGQRQSELARHALAQIAAPLRAAGQPSRPDPAAQPGRIGRDRQHQPPPPILQPAQQRGGLAAIPPGGLDHSDIAPQPGFDLAGAGLFDHDDQRGPGRHQAKKSARMRP